MRDVADLINRLRRPRLLVDAARFGVDEYRRERALPRLLSTSEAPGSCEAILLLMDCEAEMNERRKSHDGTYAAAQHIELLIALLGEARLLQASRSAEAAAQLKLSAIEPFLRATKSDSASATEGSSAGC